MDQSAVIGGIILVGLVVYGYSRMIFSGKNAGKLKEILPEAMVIDVRTVDEYRSGHFSGAANIPVEKIAKSAKRLGDKNSPKIIYCASGARAKQAARLLKGMGFRSVHVAGTLAQMNKLTA